MKRTFLMSAAALLLLGPTLSLAGLDETQKQTLQRTQEAQRKLDAARAAQGAAREKLMQEHMALMNEAMKQMRSARPGAGMTPQQMREWIDEHVKLMDQMMSQMMDSQHMMMMGPMKDGQHKMKSGK